ncbi:MAG: ceramidase domain-containing protein [Chloroflexi bacterium]|nr:ceramidase domain-containing protein [Chloroflexota bacterium]
MPNSRSVFLTPLIIFAVIVLAAIPLLWVNYSWANWQPASCMPNRCFCEALRDGFIRQPVDTFSNLPYVLVGLLMIAIARDDWQRGARNNLMQSHRAYPILFGVAAIVIGAGSFFYHASMTFIGQWFDVMGMYLFASFGLVYAYARLRPIRPAMFLTAYVIMNAMLGYSLATNPDTLRQIFAAMVYGIIALEALVLLVERPKIKTRYFLGAFLCMAVAYAIWTLDENFTLCDPASLFQGHAIWHLLTALAAFLLYVYYRSETGKSSPASLELPQQFPRA